MAINRHHAFIAVCFRISNWSRSVAKQGCQVGVRAPGCRPWERINTLY